MKHLTNNQIIALIKLHKTNPSAFIGTNAGYKRLDLERELRRRNRKAFDNRVKTLSA